MNDFGCSSPMTFVLTINFRPIPRGQFTAKCKSTVVKPRQLNHASKNCINDAYIMMTI